MMNVQKIKLSIAVIMIFSRVMSINILAQPTITVQFDNPQFDCDTQQYCVDVEFKSDTLDQKVFGMNVRFFYDDSILELIGFSDFQGGYSATAPDPPAIITSESGGPALFDFAGPAEFINGGMGLTNMSAPDIVLDTQNFTKLFRICFTVEDAYSLDSFAPSLVWDLQRNPEDGGFLSGDEGVVITVVDSNNESAPTNERVIQFNWDYDTDDVLPHGSPQVDTAINIACFLPITLLSFGGHSTISGNHLKWRTSYEYNNEGFEVQRSHDAIFWETLGFVKSKAIAQDLNDYDFKDSSPSSNKNFYRLKQMDIDGRFSYSFIIALDRDETNSSRNIEVYPNPVSEGSLTIQLSSKPTIKNKLFLYNSSAQLLRQAIMDEEFYYLDVNNLPSGLYVVRITEANTDFYKRIIIEERE